jgi:hypothetical protein
MLSRDNTVTAHVPGEASLAADSGRDVFVIGMTDEAYHARDELSASGMKVLMRSPKAFQHARSTPAKPKAEFDIGHAVHARVLGVGMPVVKIPSDILASNGAASTTKAKEFIARARSNGQVPLKADTYDLVVRGSDAVLMHPKARPLFEAPGRVSEVSGFATDPDTGVRLRMRADWIAGLQIGDLKTTTDLSTRKLMAVVDGFGYDLSAEAYRFMFELITGSVAEPMVLAFMEKEAPYDVRVVRLGDDWVEGGWLKLRAALDRYVACVESHSWPGVDEVGPVEDLPAPGWYTARTARAELDAIQEG